jgi:iron complex transport system ATP-binding protein
MTSHCEAVRLENVWFERNGRPLLEDISWCVASGERWVLLGPNGSGKTTLLRLICGYGFPSRGRMCVLNHRFGETDLRELHRHIGWVHSDLRAMIPEFMSALEVALSGRRGSLAVYDEIERTEKKAALEIMDWIGTAHLADRRFSTLSTGERQRVLIARALGAEPGLLLLDEPCLGLDPFSREEFLEFLEQLYAARRDLSVIYVTHHVEEITPTYDKLLVLKGGRRMAAGETRKTLTARVISSLYGHTCRLGYSEASRRYELSFL